MRKKLKPLVISIAIPLIVGGLSALLTMNSMETFSSLNQPPLSPPGWLFPVVWTVLYILMGIASYLVYTSNNSQSEIQSALAVYGLQLAVNFFWSLIFFNLRWFLFAFIWLVLLWVLILITLRSFHRLSKPAGWLLLPYLLWVTFAGYLNFGIFLLN